MVKNNNKIVFSSMSDDKIDFKLLNQDKYLESILNENLNIDNYSKKINRIILIYMAMNPETPPLRPDKKFWRWKSGSFDMYVNVPDFQKYCNATHKEAQKIIAELFLYSIKKYLWKRKDFDAPKFYTDVEKVFKPILDAKMTSKHPTIGGSLSVMPPYTENDALRCS